MKTKEQDQADKKQVEEARKKRLEEKLSYFEDEKYFEACCSIDSRLYDFNKITDILTTISVLLEGGAAIQPPSEKARLKITKDYFWQVKNSFKELLAEYKKALFDIDRIDRYYNAVINPIGENIPYNMESSFVLVEDEEDRELLRKAIIAKLHVSLVTDKRGKHCLEAKDETEDEIPF